MQDIHTPQKVPIAGAELTICEIVPYYIIVFHCEEFI